MKTRTEGDHLIDDKAYARRAHFAVDLLMQGKWQISVLCAMRHGPVRIGQLGRLITGASKKVLAQSLRRLEVDGIVVQRDLSELVLHVEYELRDEVRGSVVSLLDHLSAWSAYFLASGSSKSPSPKHRADTRGKDSK